MKEGCCVASSFTCEHHHPEDFPDDFLADEPDSWPPPGVWRTKQGDWIDYEDLEDSHLLNIVAMLKRTSPARARIFGLEGLEAEVTKRHLTLAPLADQHTFNS